MSTIEQPDRLLTTAQAAERLGLAEQTLANWRVARKGPAYVRIGGRTIRYRASALDAYIAGLPSEAVAA